MTGLSIIDAILAGERDPEKLASLRDRCIKADEQTIAKSLVGDYRPEHLFTLQQTLVCIPMNAASDSGGNAASDSD